MKKKSLIPETKVKNPEPKKKDDNWIIWAAWADRITFEEIQKKTGKTWDGLIAQEVKQVMDDMDVEFSGWSEGINTKQTLAYGKLVMPLIKAVQELTAKVEALEKELKDK